jgi:hypothetical protein
MYFLNVCCHSRIYRAHGIKACTTINAVLLHTTALHNACGLILESPKLSENEIEKMIVQSARQHLPILKQVGFVMHTLTQSNINNYFASLQPCTSHPPLSYSCSFCIYLPVHAVSVSIPLFLLPY